MGGIVFINYRRRDAEHVAGRLFDRLEQDFSEDQLFFDVDDIPPGEDFVDYLHAQVDACDVLLALVGPAWQNALDARDYGDGEQTKDFVRIEIEAALQKDKKVIPVLVSGAEMPREEDLPKSLQAFSRRNAVRLTHERFKADAAGIASALKAALADAEEARKSAERQRAEEERKAKAAREEKAQEKRDSARREIEPRGLQRALAGGLFTRRNMLAGAAGIAIVAVLVTAVAMIGWDRVITYAEDSSLRTFRSSYDSVFDAAFSPDGKRIVSVGGDPTIEKNSDLSSPIEERRNGASVKIWNVATGEVTRNLDNHWDAIDTVAFSPFGGTILAAGFSTLRLWDALSGEEVHRLNGRKPAAFSPDGRTIASGSPTDNGSALKLWNAFTGEDLRSFDFSGQGASLAFSPDGGTVAEGFMSIALGEVATGALIRELTGHESNTDSVVFSPDGKKLLSGNWDGTVKLWDVATGEEIRTFDGHTGAVRSVALSPDGRTALSAGDDKTIRMWDVATGENLRTFKGHMDEVWSIVFAPDGHTALSASLDGTMKLWDVTR